MGNIQASPGYNNITIPPDTLEKENTMPRVWITNFSGHNYLKASKWGELRYLTKGFVAMGSLDRVVFQVAEALAESKPDDWLLFSGMTMLAGIAAVIWYEMHGGLNVLIYDKANDDYRELKLTFAQLRQMLLTLQKEDE